MAEQHENVLLSMWRTGVWRLVPFLLIYSIGFATVFPVIPTLVTNGFASEAAGHPVDCQLYAPGKSPPECDHAHTQVVQWSAWTSLVSGALLSFVCAPAVGKMSDVWGRKPFLMSGVALALAPMVVLMLFCWGWVPIQLYYPMSALNGMVSSFAIAVMVVADLVHQVHRATCVGYLSACFSLGIMIGPALGGFINNVSAIYVCIAMIGASLLYLLIFMPETAPRLRARKGETDADKAADTAACDPLLSSQDDIECCDTAAAAQGSYEPIDLDPIPPVVPHAPTPHVLPHPHERQPLLGGHHAAHEVSAAGQRGTTHATAPGGNEAASMRHRPQKGGGGADPLSPAGSSTSGECTAHIQAARGAGAKKSKESDSGSRPATSSGAGDMLLGWRIIKASSYYQKLAVVWVIVSMTFEGAQDLLMQYLQDRIDYFNTADQARLLIIVAICGLAIKLLLMSSLVRLLGEQWLLVVGLSAYLIEDLLLAQANTTGKAQAAIAVGSFACVCWPAAVALQTKHVAPEDMGAVQGALHGISSLAGGTGPMLFAALFSIFLQQQYGLPRWPQVVWYVAAALGLVGILITATLHWSESADVARATAAQARPRSGQAEDVEGGPTKADEEAPHAENMA